MMVAKPLRRKPYLDFTSSDEEFKQFEDENPLKFYLDEESQLLKFKQATDALPKATDFEIYD
jgi:hypothetical protein